MKKTAPTAEVRVLVIDDDEELASVIVESLRERGITAWAIRPLPSSPLGNIVSTASMFRPHAILVDVVMPVNTAKLVRGLRSSPSLKDTRIFGCSGHVVLAGGFARYLDGFLHKPFTITDLVDVICDGLGMSAPVDDENGSASSRR